jgi:hypothetical protein
MMKLIRRIFKALGLLKVEYRQVEIYTTLKSFDDAQEAYWVALSHIANSEELRFCLHTMANAIVAEIEQGTGPGDAPHVIEHKAGALYGIRQVEKMLRIAPTKVRAYRIQRQIEEEQ